MKIKNTFLLIVLTNLSAVASFGQGTKGNDPTVFTWIFENIILLMGAAILLAGIVTILKLSMGLLELQRIKIMQEMGEDPHAIMQKMGESKIKKFNDWFWSRVPERSEADMDLGHDYDGIRELDNSLPPWWLYMFYGCIIFAGIYMFKYHWSDSEWSSLKEYEMQVKEAEEVKLAFLDKMANAVNESNVTRLDDDASLQVGKDIYMSQCASCHGQLGEGMVGPNFSDPYWIHGGGIKNVFKTIKYGVPAKGMISWKEQLKPSSIQKVASYILTLEGTDPPNQKGREGDLWEEGDE